jgi:large subunit ribosomal protein L9
MQIILTTDVPSLGDAGDLVEVKAGYGANYLIPQGLALPATSSNKNQIEHQRRAISARIARDRQDAEGLAAKLSHLSVTITRLVGDDDKLFGSVSNKDIAEALRDQGHEVDRRKIILDAPIKALGVYDVPVKVHRDVIAQIKLWVVAD